MLIEKYKKIVKLGGNYIAECNVFNIEENKNYYVVVQLGDLLYATFESSYIDYKKGINKKIPKKIEGENYLWFDYCEDRSETPFRKCYIDMLNLASNKQKKDYISKKYSHLKKPLKNFKYEIIEKKTKPVFGCGPMGDIYEIKFHMIDNDDYLWVYSDDACGAFSLNTYSVYDAIESENLGNNNIEYLDPIEELPDFSKAKKSKYYDLYLEMEKYKDGYFD